MSAQVALFRSTERAVKPCFRCGLVFPLAEFYRHPQMPDGHVNKCKSCNKQDVREWYSRTRATRHLYDRQRFKTPERKQTILEMQRRRRERNPEKHRAHVKVRRAIKAGLLIRQPCQVCGASRVEAHHDDYSKPLDVEWLCFRCHRTHGHGQTVTI